MIVRSNDMQDTGSEPDAYSMAPNASVTLVPLKALDVTVDV
jgi:hypothetical protein